MVTINHQYALAVCPCCGREKPAKEMRIKPACAACRNKISKQRPEYIARRNRDQRILMQQRRAAGIDKQSERRALKVRIMLEVDWDTLPLSPAEIMERAEAEAET